MAKIIKESKSKPIKCECCGCVYEFESGDKIELTSIYVGGEGIVLSRLLDCPNCGQHNSVEFITEDEIWN